VCCEWNLLCWKYAIGEVCQTATTSSVSWNGESIPQNWVCRQFWSATASLLCVQVLPTPQIARHPHRPFLWAEQAQWTDADGNSDKGEGLPDGDRAVYRWQAAPSEKLATAAAAWDRFFLHVFWSILSAHDSFVRHFGLSALEVPVPGW